MDLKQLLEAIRKQLNEIAQRQAAGEPVDEGRKNELEERARALEALLPPEVVATVGEGTGEGTAPAAAASSQNETPEQELARLRAEAADRKAREEAESAVKAALGVMRTEEEQQAERVKRYALEAVAEHVASGNPQLQDAVKSILRESHGQSRFVGQGAERRAVAAVGGREDGGAAFPGGSSVAEHRIEVSEPNEVEAIEKRKSIAEFMLIASHVKSGLASPAEVAFVRKHSQKAMAEGTGSAGGFLVPEEWMPDILGLLRAQAVVRRAGPRFQSFGKLMNQISVSTGATAYYVAENARITTSEPTLAETPLLTPKNLTGLVPVSNFLLGDTAEADAMVRTELAEALGDREDLAFLQDDGTGNTPVGLRNIVGRTQNPLAPGANGITLDLADVRRIRAATRGLNARNPQWVWFFADEFITHLETLQDPDGRFLADTSLLQINPDGMSGRLDGIPFLSTTLIPTNLTFGTSTNATYLILANMREVVVGINKELMIDVSSEATYWDGTTWRSAFQENQTLYRAVMRHDIAARRPSHVIVQEGVLV